ncbi:MAG: class I SAM-dependent methyltransferase [Lachnospiraceae bacterium]|jgi:hypothetical protein|nr:class I SAM-dependent methyltransferase [Lachnospiraceae bacterium]
MYFPEKYLSGSEINTGYTINYSLDKTTLSKQEFLMEKCHGKKIIHLGFCDHIEVIDLKIKHNLWLHAKLLEVAAKCVGLDTNKSAIEHVRKLGYRDVFFCDITTCLLPEIGSPFTEGEVFDYILLPDILEHIPNPVFFLKSLQSNYGKYFNKVIVTVPNAFCEANHKWALENVECINTDHFYLFSPYTLAKCLYAGGYGNFKFDLVTAHSLRILNYKHYKTLWRMHHFNRLIKHPLFKDTIVCECDALE